MIFNLTSPGGIYPESAKNGAIRQIVFRLFQSGSHPYIQSASMGEKKKKNTEKDHSHIHTQSFLSHAGKVRQSTFNDVATLHVCSFVLSLPFHPPPAPARLSLSLTHTYTSTHSHTRTHWA